MKHVLKDLNNYLELSKINYIKKLGNLQTTGTETTYFSPKTKHYDFNWDEEVKKLNPTLYAKYLKVYNNE